jgi:CRISPR/Cas system-associated exonuclease Cas4 (RecB family)
MNDYISYSALDTYLRCPKKFKFSYIDGLFKQEYQASPLTMGTAIHVGMAFGLMLYHNSDYELTFDELREQLEEMLIEWRETNKPIPRMKFDDYGNLIEDESSTIEFYEMVDIVKDIVYRTFVYLDINNNWRIVVHNEQPLIEYRDRVVLYMDNGLPMWFRFQIDTVMTSLNDGLTFLFDWKSRRSFQDEEKESSISGEDFNIQMSLYQKAMQLLGINIDATVCFQISPFNPKTPDTLKNGRISKSNIKTDWETYAAAIVANGESPDDPYYADMKEKLGDPKWFSPITIFRSQTELDNRWKLAQDWTKQIYSPTQEYLPAISPMCVNCSFAKLCLGKDRGYDVDEIKEREYSIKED